jgi:gamma-glutamyl-gamma-aminobutyrate hydrolase PuuD
VYDIAEKFGENHPFHHKLNWISPSPLAEIFPEVNSIHHQAISRLGESGTILAVEPKTILPEVAVWENKYLGVQFHPELMAKSPELVSFVNYLDKWVSGVKETPATKKPRTPKKVEDYVYASPNSFWDSTSNSDF